MALQEKLIDGIGSLGWTINIWSPERKLTNGSSVRKTVREVGGRKGYNNYKTHGYNNNKERLLLFY